MPVGCPIGDNCNSDVGGEPDALKGASPVRRGAEGRSLRDATRPTLRLPAYFYPGTDSADPVDPSARQDAIDAFFGAIPVMVRHGGDRAFFQPTFDYIQMPHLRSFKTMDHYASVRAHETTHWSGATARLARTFGKRFGDQAYAFEELVAEIGSGLICAQLGLPNELHDNHASYVAHWLGILRADKTAIIHAAAKAEQAFNYLLAFRSDHLPQDAPASSSVDRLSEAA